MEQPHGVVLGLLLHRLCGLFLWSGWATDIVSQRLEDLIVVPDSDCS